MEYFILMDFTKTTMAQNGGTDPLDPLDDDGRQRRSMLSHEETHSSMLSPQAEPARSGRLLAQSPQSVTAHPTHSVRPFELRRHADGPPIALPDNSIVIPDYVREGAIIGYTPLDNPIRLRRHIDGPLSERPPSRHVEAPTFQRIVLGREVWLRAANPIQRVTDDLSNSELGHYYLRNWPNREEQPQDDNSSSAHESSVVDDSSAVLDNSANSLTDLEEYVRGENID
jgi:hypothetical protein